ncbi:zinc finger BED domain-containing protein RICESLEEPER 1-like [Castanea sativa]|uniref:zinc finger BED domain-containing protein RICESLEEPER 1-like n=1 Tax=Castanea sativa TaxID=21020 RepID=UPI003F64EF3B
MKVGVESEVAIANFKYDHAKKISRNTARNDCISTFELEKKKLKTMLGSVNRVNLIADFWKYGQKIGYMCLIYHFVDSSWKLQKRIINFCDVPPPHSGVVISDAIFKSLLDWGHENKVCIITLDNANNNDATVKILKDAIKRKLMLGGKIFHVRCCAHIINLLLQDGLSEIETVIENVRESVKYLIASEACLIKFGEIAKQLQLPSKKLILDCPTRWNATYAMLLLPWSLERCFLSTKIEMRVFDEVKNVISGSEYPTANIFLLEVWKIKEVLNEKSLDENDYISAMACKIKLKFDKYCGECNFVMSIAAVLDPWFKMTLINFSFPKIYQGFEVVRNIDHVHDSLYQLYNEYVVDYTSSNAGQNASKSTEGSSSVGGNNSKFKTRGRMEFDQFVRNVDNIQLAKSDLDVYLEECVFLYSDDSDLDFDVLEWWKANNLKFCILSKMASDILSILITTVASGSAFSIGGRVIDVYRASLSTKTVQALLCGGDWVRPLYKNEKQSKLEG